MCSGDARALSESLSLLEFRTLGQSGWVCVRSECEKLHKKPGFVASGPGSQFCVQKDFYPWDAKLVKEEDAELRDQETVSEM